MLYQILDPADNIFQIRYVLGLISNLLNSIFAYFPIFVQYFGRHFQTVCRIVENNTPLERYGKCAPFICLAIFQIPYSLRADLKINIYVVLDFRSSGQYFCN